MGQRIRVMLVDDSVVIRGLIERALRSAPDIEIVAQAGDGEAALKLLAQNPADVIILDIEMPVMDGITALPKILAIAPKTKIIMASTLTTRNAEISLRALQLGATDYLPKPSAKDLGNVGDFFRDLIEKIRALAPKGLGQAIPSAQATGVTAKHGLAGTYVPIAAPTAAVKKSDVPPLFLKALAIASSTGGPQALIEIFKQFKGINVRVPVFITQHMPPNFTTILAEHISKSSGLVAAEAKDGEVVIPGRIYVAPGDYHMTVEQQADKLIVRLDQNEPENFCRPSADPMLRSLAKIYRDKLLVCVLTGLGADGARGSVDVVAANGTVVAQDEETSVVYGMPKAVADAKLTSAILPLPRIAPYLIKAVGQS